MRNQAEDFVLERTLSIIGQRCCFGSIRKCVLNHIQTCEECIFNKQRSGRLEVLCNPIVPERRVLQIWTTWGPSGSRIARNTSWLRWVGSRRYWVRGREVDIFWTAHAAFFRSASSDFLHRQHAGLSLSRKNITPALGGDPSN